MTFNPKWIVGKRVAAVEMRPFDDGKGGKAHAPIIRFADGSFIEFTTEETEVGEYGTSIDYRKPRAALREE